MNQQKEKVKPTKKALLPFDGLSIDKQINILQSLTSWYGKNKKPVTYHDIGGVDASKYNVSSTFRFFSKIGWLQEQGSGTFEPCEDLVQYFEGIDQQPAANNLADKIFQSPIGLKLSFFLEQKAGAIEADIITYLGSEFRLKKSDKSRILKLIELLTILSGLSKEDDKIILRKKEVRPSGLAKAQKISQVETQIQGGQNQINLFIGVLVDPNTPEEKIRKSIRITLDEIKKVMANEKR